ncbi:hypothetical protein PanWU01x14_305700 [Parasponia andersonii]|uniref:Uncharacterized protein n=1 Tax=Parasponia andersonii TaxID=3476 RepID=A0A2P5ASD3_PARAD|nr:hypothetical protein PanWU01x14_305700 [Parasponia andersonii]
MAILWNHGRRTGVPPPRRHGRRDRSRRYRRRPGPTERLQGRTQATRRGSLGVHLVVLVMRMMVLESASGSGAVHPVIGERIAAWGAGVLVTERRRERVRRRGEVGLGLGSAEGASRRVVGTRRVVGGVEGAEPDPGLLPGVSDLGRESPPRSLPHAPVPDLLQARSVARPNRRRRLGRRSNASSGGGSSSSPHDSTTPPTKNPKKNKI